MEITVKGGYSPNLIRATEGVPLGWCSTGRRTATAHRASCSPTLEEQVARRLWPDDRRAHACPGGEYGFACGMNMLHGTLVVDAGDGDGEGRADWSRAPVDATAGTVATHTHEAARAVGVGPTQAVRGTGRVEFLAPGRRGRRARRA